MCRSNGMTRAHRTQQHAIVGCPSDCHVLARAVSQRLPDFDVFVSNTSTNGDCEIICLKGLNWKPTIPICWHKSMLHLIGVYSASPVEGQRSGDDKKALWVDLCHLLTTHSTRLDHLCQVAVFLPMCK